MHEALHAFSDLDDGPLAKLLGMKDDKGKDLSDAEAKRKINCFLKDKGCK